MKSLVCTCNNISQSEIKKAIVRFGITTTQEVSLATKAGTTCGRCISIIKKIILENNQNDQLRIKWPTK